MHIELTDHLRCPQSHEESYLILLPETMAGRRVMAGVLACPTCGWQCAWADGVPDFDGGWSSHEEAPAPAEAVPAMLGIEGAGGWIALAGSAGGLAPALMELLPGVGIIAVNPPEFLTSSEAISILRSKAWPIKSHSMRGVVLGEDAEHLRDEVAMSLLPGRQMVGAGRFPAQKLIEILGNAGGVWVGARKG